jgi:hypothetical protein
VDYGLEQAQSAVLLSFSGDLQNPVFALVEREFSTTHKVFFLAGLKNPCKKKGKKKKKKKKKKGWQGWLLQQLGRKKERKRG